MADGYARATGKVGVCIGTSGPGATNMVTGIATAMMDSVPMVVITGQVPTYMIGKDAFQETDTTGITMPITKHNYLVMDVKDLAGWCGGLPHRPHRAPRPGADRHPQGRHHQRRRLRVPGEGRPCPVPAQDAGHIEPDAPGAELLDEAPKPLILAGHGVILAGAYDELRDFAEKTQHPGASPPCWASPASRDAPPVLRLAGHARHVLLQQGHLQLRHHPGVGMRLDDRVTGRLNAFPPTPRSSTSTSTRRSWARTSPPRCRSSATPSTC